MWILLSIIAGASLLAGHYGYTNAMKTESNNRLNFAQQRLMQYSNSKSIKEFEAYLRDAMFLGYIDGNTYKNTLSAYTKLRNNGYDFSKLDREDSEAITKMYNSLYQNDDHFRSLWDNTYSDMSDEDKLAFIRGAGSTGMSIPAPAYLDTSFANYQKEVEPVKFYTNKELADIYNIDYDFDNIKRDYDEAAEGAVKYANWQQELLGNRGERDNTKNITSYLDAIRNNKFDAIQNGISNGARAAAELLLNNEALNNKAVANADIATQRFEALNDSLLQRAQTEINAYDMYDSLAQVLSKSGVGLYANDIERKGSDTLANANFFSSDSNLRAERAAQNKLMASLQALANANNDAAKAQADAAWNYFNEISMPANDYNLAQAMSDYIGLGYAQDTGYANPMAKWGSGVNK